MKNTLQAGFARVNITPPLGTPLLGYFNVVERLAETIMDQLEVNALAVSDGKNKVVMLSADLTSIKQCVDEYRQRIASEVDLPVESIMLSVTHTHSAPMTFKSSENDHRIRGSKYIDFLVSRFCDAAKLALADLKPAKMGWAVGHAPNVSFNRRYLMKNGCVRTNPDGYENDIVRPVNVADDRVNVLRFLREGGKEIALVNFGNHPCTLLDDNKVSADYPRFVRETVEAVLPVHCLFFTGFQGDINHKNFQRTRFQNDPYVLAHDDIDRGYNYTGWINAKHIGRAVGGAVLQVYGDMEWVDVDTVGAVCGECTVPTNRGNSEEILWARHVIALHKAQKDDQIEYDPERIKLSHVIAKANRILRLENGPDTFTIPVCAVRIGPAVFVGIAGEPFNSVGLTIKEKSPFDVTLTGCDTNGAVGYFPMQECYDEGGYEAGSSPFAPGVGEKLIETGLDLMNKLK